MRAAYILVFLAIAAPQARADGVWCGTFDPFLGLSRGKLPAPAPDIRIVRVTAQTDGVADTRAASRIRNELASCVAAGTTLSLALAVSADGTVVDAVSTGAERSCAERVRGVGFGRGEARTITARLTLTP